MNGTHRPDGIWIAHGEGAARPRSEGAAPAARPHLRDVAPTLLAALGVAWEDEGAGPDGSDLLRERVAYSEAEEEQVAQRLRALGYLE